MFLSSFSTTTISTEIGRCVAQVRIEKLEREMERIKDANERELEANSIRMLEESNKRLRDTEVAFSAGASGGTSLLFVVQ